MATDEQIKVDERYKDLRRMQKRCQGRKVNRKTQGAQVKLASKSV